MRAESRVSSPLWTNLARFNRDHWSTSPYGRYGDSVSLCHKNALNRTWRSAKIQQIPAILPMPVSRQVDIWAVKLHTKTSWGFKAIISKPGTLLLHINWEVLLLYLFEQLLLGPEPIFPALTLWDELSVKQGRGVKTMSPPFWLPERTCFPWDPLDACVASWLVDLILVFYLILELFKRSTV